jgi:hypothetical protein
VVALHENTRPVTNVILIRSILSAKLPEATRSKKYSFSDKWPLARNSRLNRMYNAPRDAIFHVIHEEWECHQIGIDAEAPKPFWPNRKITLPSKGLYPEKLF